MRSSFHVINKGVSDIWFGLTSLNFSLVIKLNNYTGKGVNGKTSLWSLINQ